MGDLIHLADSLPATVGVDVVDTWPVWIQAGAAAVTAIGLITAGLWALIRFKRGRMFMERCSIDLSCTVVSVRGKTGILVNVIVKNCGDSQVVFETTDPAGVEVSSISTEDWRGLQDCRWVQWQKENSGDEVKEENSGDEVKVWESEDYQMIEDLLEDCGGRLDPVSLEPGQDLSRSCLFIMPEEWVAARVRCVFALTASRTDGPRWLATRVVTRPSLDETVRIPQMGRVLRDKGWRR